MMYGSRWLAPSSRPHGGRRPPLSAADAARIDADVERARHMHSCARMLLTDGLRPLATAWGLSESQVDLVREQFARVVGHLTGAVESAAR